MNRHGSTLARPRMDPVALSGTQYRGVAVIVGALFMGQIITFAVGSSLIDSYLRGDSAKATLAAGVLLEMCSAVAIVVIGLLMYRVLRRVDPRWALGYPIMRVTEFTVSALLRHTC